MDILKTAHLTKSFGVFKLEDISINFPEGYVLGLVGENGAGKSSLIKLLSGLCKADSGELMIEGTDMTVKEAETRGMVSVLYDSNPFRESFKPKAFGRFYGSGFRSFDQRSYEKYLEEFEVPPNMQISRLSKGMKKRQYLAFVLACDARLYIFDEPTEGVDADFRSRFLDICQELIEKGEKSVILSSQITTDLDRIADYVAYIEQGRLLLYGEKDTILENYRIVQGNRAEMHRIGKNRFIHIQEKEYSSEGLVCVGSVVPCFGTSPVELLELARTENAVPQISQLMYHLAKRGRKENEKIS